MELVVATKNKDKLREIKSLLRGLPLSVLSLRGFKDVPRVKEDGKTLEANAVKKAVMVSRSLKKLAIADDSGLEIAALGKRPGVYSARFAGRNAAYSANNAKVLRLLKGVPSSKRKALFRCVMAVADRGRLVGIREGRIRGRITNEPHGRSGFGYDPLFIPNGYNKTFAQMGIRKKNKISHRSRALNAAKKVIERHIRSSD